MTYVFDVKEISYGSVSVEADNEEEAREKAWEEYNYGNTYWGDSDIDIEFSYNEDSEHITT